jgi:hypothetical protein
MPLVLVRFPDMLQVEAYVHEVRASKDNVKPDSDESMLVNDGSSAVIRQCLVWDSTNSNLERSSRFIFLLTASKDQVHGNTPHLYGSRAGLRAGFEKGVRYPRF